MTEDTGEPDGREDDTSGDESDGNEPRVDEFGITEDVVRSADDDRPSSGEPTAEADDDADRSSAAETEANVDAPLGSLASSVADRRGRSSDQPEDDPFNEESVPEIDTDVVWERIDDDEPPEVACTHEGTEILELVDMDHFRVVDCPKVRENERLERL